MSTRPAPTRALPARPSLAQLRKQAKELLKSFRAGNAAAVAEIARFEQRPDSANFNLADAQRVLARAYGFSSWPALKNHIDGANFTELLEAADQGDIAAVRRIANTRPDLINPRHAEFRDSALHRAVLRRNEELTRALMRLGADAHVGFWPHRDATSPYAIAVDRDYGEIVAAIEDEETNRRASLSQGATTPQSSIDALRHLILAGHFADAIAMMESDPELVGASDIHGITPLHLAAWKHDPALVRWLLDHGASPAALASCAEPVQQEPAPSGRTPLDFAALVAGWPSDACTSDLYFMENAQVDPARFFETARLLIERGAELTPRAAVALGDRDALLRLHRDGRLANEAHTFRGGLLSIAVRTNRIEMVATLLDLGLDPDESIVTDDDARSWGMPLWFASMCGRHDIAELLLSCGADVNAIVYACGDALCMAADDKMEALLLKHGARLTVEQLPDGEQGRQMAQAILAGTMPAASLNIEIPTPVELAEQMLCGAGSSDPEIVRMCLPHMLRAPDDPWWNDALMHATLPESFQLILNHGIHPDVRGESGYTILHHLATPDAGRKGSFVPTDQQRLLRATMLLDAGASLTVRDPLLNSTPLGWACRWGRIDLVQLYLTRGADAREPDAEPWATPLAWASKRGHQQIVQRLHASSAQP